jgi:hypothetical protein
VQLDIGGGGSAIAGEPQAFGPLGIFRAFDPNGNIVTNSAGFAATINWGDGTTSPGVITVYSTQPNMFAIGGAHTYPDPSNNGYSVLVTLTDPNGVTYNTQTEVFLSRPPENLSDSILNSGSAFNVTAGQPLTAAVVRIHQINASLPVTGLAANVFNLTTETVSPSHIVPTGQGEWLVYDDETFTGPGPNSIHIQLSDAEGDEGTIGLIAFEVAVKQKQAMPGGCTPSSFTRSVLEPAHVEARAANEAASDRQSRQAIPRLNRKVLEWATHYAKSGEKVGENGTCWELVQTVLDNAGAKDSWDFDPKGDRFNKTAWPNVDYTWGRLVATLTKDSHSASNILPGDIVQMSGEVRASWTPKAPPGFHYKDPWTYHVGHHSAIVMSIQGNTLTFVEQGTDVHPRVSPVPLNLDGLTSGTIKVYRPVPK